ncbi:HAMP domain-containing histidine kinase [candidate division WOR-3 bacterium]|nr:HAMP domain-containing histidine kinase [candidate division WOR-3 bacterium]
MSNLIRKLHSSVFTKLLFVIIITGIIVVIIFGGFTKYYFSQLHPLFKKNVVHYVNYIIRDVGMPPDTLKALKISQDFSIHIRFEGPNFQWTTDEKCISFKEFDRITSSKYKHKRTEWDEGIYYIAVSQDSGRFLFAFDFKKDEINKGVLVFLLVILLIFVFSSAYLLIRRILKPIKWLTEGVEQISKSNLDYQLQVEPWRRDELGKLAVSFNDMTKQIREMIRSKEQLLLDVSHELRSPLTRMNVALEFVPDGDTKESIREDLLEMEKMIAEILETERLNSNHGKLNLRKANVLALIKEIVQSLQNRPPGVKLILVAEKVFLEIDTDRIKTVLKNILENSLKYSKPESHPIEISIDDRDKFVVIQIKDYGTGIPKKDLPYIFEPFYRIDKSRSKKTGGYGLGMSLCKKIMHAHGGTIEISSKLNIGTTIFLRFQK